MATLLTKKSDTASSVPLAADLTNAAGGAELAVNTADKRLYSKTSGGTVVELGTNPSSMTLPSATSQPSGTANGIPYLNGSKVLTTGSALTFNGTTFGLSGNQTVSGADGLFVSGAVSGSSPFITGGNLELGATASSALIQAYNRPSFGAYNLDLKTTTAFTFSLAGSEQMRLTSTGLGIGTSSPFGKLDVNGTIAISASGGASIYFRTSGTTNYSWANQYPAAGNFSLYDHGAGATVFTVNSGNLGLGVTPVAGYGKSFQINGGGSATNALITQPVNLNDQRLYLTNNALPPAGAFTGGFNYTYTGASATAYQQTAGAHFWFTAPSGTAGNAISFTQAMTLDASGNLLVGTTSRGHNGGATSFDLDKTDGALYITHATGTPSGYYFASFGYNTSSIGSITQSGTTAVLYNVTSDQRLKENIVDAPEFGSVIDSIKVRSYDWKADGNHQRAGFIAQELVTVAPEAVHQPADPEEMMAVDYSKLVPMLIKEIQSLRKRLAAAGI